MAKKQVPVEREYVVPLRKEWTKVVRHKRTQKAMKGLKEFIARHMRIPDRDIKKVKVDKWVNNEMWRRGIKNPLNKIKVKVKKDGENVIVTLAEIPEKIKYKVARDEKMKKESEKKKDKNSAKKSEEKVEEKPKTEEEKKTEIEKEESVKEEKAKQAEVQHKEQKHIAKVKPAKTERIQRKALQK